MPQIQLTCDTLGKLDEGATQLAIDAAIRTIITDLEDRGHDREKRMLTIALSFRRIEKSHVATQVEVTTKLPPYRTIGTKHNLTAEGGEFMLKFKDDAPEDPNQSTIQDFIDKQAVAGQ